MKFTAISSCRRSVREQKLIYACLEAYKIMPEDKQSEVKALIGDIAENAPEGRALFGVLVNKITPETAGTRTGVSVRRIYAMRSEFYERFSVW